jgi:hypothetical protein
MIKVAHVHPIGDDALTADAHIEMAIHSVVLTEHTLVADAKGSFVCPQDCSITDMHPSPQDDATEIPPPFEPDTPAEE